MGCGIELFRYFRVLRNGSVVSQEHVGSVFTTDPLIVIR